MTWSIQRKRRGFWLRVMINRWYFDVQTFHRFVQRRRHFAISIMDWPHRSARAWGWQRDFRSRI